MKTASWKFCTGNIVLVPLSSQVRCGAYFSGPIELGTIDLGLQAEVCFLSASSLAGCGQIGQIGRVALRFCIVAIHTCARFWHRPNEPTAHLGIHLRPVGADGDVPSNTFHWVA